MKIMKPWGYEIIIAHTDRYAGKILHIKAGEETSLHYHAKKKETIYLYKGAIKVETKNKTEILKTGGSIEILPGALHREKAIIESELIEVSTPEINDIVRVEDKYGRG